MSKKSWLAEYYPTTGEEAAKGTNLQAVQHSLQKWRGLRAENLAKHNVTVNRIGCVVSKRGSQVLEMSSESCALCHKHCKRNEMFRSCNTCPITRTTGKRCDYVNYGAIEEKLAPWGQWIFKRDPEPMIVALEKAEASLIRAKNRRRKTG